MKPESLLRPKSIIWLSILCTSLLFTGCIEKELSPEQESLLITKADFETYGVIPSMEPAKEKLYRDAYVDGSTELNYDFESAEADPNVLFISHYISLEPSDSDARISYSGYSIGVTLGGGLGLNTETQDHLFRYGEQSSFAVMQNDAGEGVGNIFVFQKGKTAGFLMIVGVYFDEMDQWELFIRPKLDALEAYAATR